MKKELSTFVVLSVVRFVINKLVKMVFPHQGKSGTGVLAAINHLVENEDCPQGGKTLLTSII